MMSTEITDLPTFEAALRKIAFQKGDVLVAHMDEQAFKAWADMPYKARRRLSDMWKEALPGGTRIFVVPPGMSVELLRPRILEVLPEEE